MRYSKGQGFNKVYLKPINVMGGSCKVITYKEWKDLLEGDFGKSIGIKW